MTIWSMTEVAIGIVVANLPPLRKSFDAMLRRIIPASLLSKYFSNGGTGDFDKEGPYLPTYRMNEVQQSNCREPTGDSDSDKAILAFDSTISKTTDIVVDEQPRKGNWRD